MAEHQAEPQEIPLELDNQDLKEIIEIASQITTQLEVENVIKNVVLSLVARFDSPTVTFVLPNEVDEQLPMLYHFEGQTPVERSLELPSMHTIRSFLEKHEYSQMSFAFFMENFPDRCAVRSFQTLRPDIILPMRTEKGVGGLLLLPPKKDGEGYSPTDIQYVTQIVRFASIAIENASLYFQAATDRMTKLFSHHFFHKSLEEEISRAHRYGTTFSLIMFDIDHFKKFNDTYGHLQGDEIIKDIALILRRSVRGIDFTARYGGEEFAVILPEVNIQGAAVVAERLRRAVEGYPFRGEEGPLHVTISIGVTEFHRERTRSSAEIMRGVDRALYQSKEMGRNRVTLQR